MDFSRIRNTGYGVAFCSDDNSVCRKPMQSSFSNHACPIEFRMLSTSLRHLILIEDENHLIVTAKSKFIGRGEPSAMLHAIGGLSSSMDNTVIHG